MGIGKVSFCLVVLAFCVGCEESSVLPPTAPTPLPSDKVGGLTIACPTDMTVQSFNESSAVVSYPDPSVEGGLEPISTECIPPSGNSFSIGDTTSECTTSDDLGQTASCSFQITVLPPPELAVTRFLAFGDSLTAGVISSPLALPGPLAFPTPSLSYPTKLRFKLRNAYPVQSIVVINSGLSGEEAVQATSRFQSEISRVGPDVVLIMAGTNDVNKVSNVVTPSQAAIYASEAIESMVLDAEGRGIDPILATIPPIRSVAGKEDNAQAARELNSLIRSIAIGRGIPLVDVFDVINNGDCSASASANIPCLGEDGIHPTQEGYQRIANRFFNVIVNEYDVPVSSGAVPVGAQRVR